MKLFLGCGPMPFHPYHKQYVDESWTFIDLYEKHPDIVSMDARYLEYPDNSTDEIYASHLLEHFATREVFPTLKEWYRVLKPGGKLRINVPDLKWCAKCILGQKYSSFFDRDRRYIDMLYGNQENEGEFHKTGFTKELLEDYLIRAGFREINIDQRYEAHDMGCLLAVAYK